MLATDTTLAIFIRLASVWYVFYVSLQSFMTCGRIVKEFSFISDFLFLPNLLAIAFAERFPLPYIRSPIAP